MQSKFYLVVLFFILIIHNSFAQHKCGFDAVHKHKMYTDAAYKLYVTNFKNDVINYVNNSSSFRPNATTIIPVVVHIMHTGGALGSIYNPSDASIIATIAYMNQVFAGTYPGSTAPGTPTSNAAGNMEIQFALAQRTPTCGATNGIDRVNCNSNTSYSANGVNSGSSGSGISDLALKNISRWDNNSYYNIWVVNKIDGADGTAGQFIAGYAYFAGASADVDGTVLLATQFAANNITLPHELGHAFNLYHPFETSNVNNQCPNVTGDEVADTDPVAYNANSMGVVDFSCRTGANPCNGGANFGLNTESNIMGYTNCTNLFTIGQKNRVQTTLSSGTRAALANSLGATACGPVINFNLNTATMQEFTTTTLGCRNYTDYNYTLQIGQLPTANAMVTINKGGSATDGVDYNFTTNGSFTSPSNTVNFNTTGATSQTLTLRVYNDAIVENSEALNLTLSLNNGGGNAAIGSINPALNITIIDNDIAPTPFFNTAAANIGADNNFNDNLVFFAPNAKHKGHVLVTAAQLNASGITGANILTQLKVVVFSKQSTTPFNNYSLSILPTNITAFTSSTFINGAFTQVYSGNFTTTVGENTFAFTTPYSWNGTDNLILQVCYDNGATITTNGDPLVSASAANIIGIQNIATNYSGALTPCTLTNAVGPFYSNEKALMKFAYQTPGTVVETTLNASKIENLTLNSNDNFYSATNNIMATIKNADKDLGCVTTSIDAAGNTWLPLGAGERSGKVFKITPTLNITNTFYNISAYFTNAELNGRLPANLRLAKSTSTTIAGISLANSFAAGNHTFAALGPNNTFFNGNFLGFSYFFLVDASVVLLPVKLVQFNGAIVNNTATLKWLTNNEINCNGYFIEKSTDGLNFTSLGFVAAKNNAVNNYAFVNNTLYPNNYYRLKIVNNNSGFSYTNTILLKANNTNQYIVSVVNNYNSNLLIYLNKLYSGSTTFNLLNVSGQLLQTQKTTNINNLYNFKLPSQLTKGVYLLQINTNGQVLRKKIIL